MSQSGIRTSFKSKTGWVECVSHACMSVACVSLTLIYLLQLLDVALGL